MYPVVYTTSQLTSQGRKTQQDALLLEALNALADIFLPLFRNPSSVFFPGIQSLAIQQVASQWVRSWCRLQILWQPANWSQSWGVAMSKIVVKRTHNKISGVLSWLQFRFAPQHGSSRAHRVAFLTSLGRRPVTFSALPILGHAARAKSVKGLFSHMKMSFRSLGFVLLFPVALILYAAGNTFWIGFAFAGLVVEALAWLSVLRKKRD